MPDARVGRLARPRRRNREADPAVDRWSNGHRQRTPLEHQGACPGRARLGRDRTEADPTYDQGHKIYRGYLVGDRFIPDSWSGSKTSDDTQVVYLVEPG